MDRSWTLAFGTFCLVACSATISWSQQATFLKEPVHAKANMKSSPKFDDRVFYYRAELISGEILDHNVGGKEVVLGIGAKDGVRFGHAFIICPAESEVCVGVAKVMELEKGRCIAKVVSIEKDQVEKSLKGFRAVCAAPKRNVRKAYAIELGFGKAAIELGFSKTVWQTESLENKIIRGLLEIGDREFPILIRQENTRTTNTGPIRGPAGKTEDAPFAALSQTRAADQQPIPGTVRGLLPSIVTVTRTNSKTARPEPNPNWHSGVIVDERGYILTMLAREDVDRDQIRVRLADQSEFAAEVVATDLKLHLAVLRIRSARHITAAPVSKARSPNVGDSIIAVPSPAQRVARTGVVKAIEQSLGDEFPPNLIHSDLPLPLGEGGSLMVTDKGEPAGIWVAIRATERTSSYAVPLADVAPLLTKALAQHVKEKEDVRTEVAEPAPGTPMPGTPSRPTERQEADATKGSP